jgi:hypothetical protein
MSTHTIAGRICAPEVAKLVIDTPPPEALPLALLAVTVSVGP